MNNKSRWIGYVICSGIGFALACLVLGVRNIFSVTEQREIIKILCDAFTIPGVLLILFGVLVLIAREGTFDGLVYAFRRVGDMLIPFYRSKAEKYSDYKAKKDEKHKKDKESGVGFIFFVGLAFFLVAIVFLVIYYTM